MTSIAIWTAPSDESPLERILTGPSVLSSRGIEPVDVESGSRGPEGPVLIPTVSPETLCVLLVPPGLPHAVRRNGSALGRGLHELRHADLVEYDGLSAWISGQRDPEVVEYDPEVHGADVFCFRTKIRLSKSERIVICPGPPSQPRRCGRMFREVAWTSETRCHQCGFDAAQPRWKPPRPSRRRELQRILSLAVGG